MPNWCYTRYAITGERKQLDELYKIMKDLQDLDEPLVPNGFGTKWLGCLVAKLGKAIDGEEGLYCRGDWDQLEQNENGTVTFSTETAWDRMTNVENLIRSTWNGLNIFFMAEECGNGLYETNDTAGQFFPDRYIIDSESDEMDYYTLEEALEYLTSFFGEEVTSWEQGCTLAKKWNDKADEEDTENHIWLHEYDVEE